MLRPDSARPFRESGRDAMIAAGDGARPAFFVGRLHANRRADRCGARHEVDGGEVDRFLMLPVSDRQPVLRKNIEDSFRRVLTVFRACEVARHRTYPPLPASRKLTCPFGRAAPLSAPADRGSPARPGSGRKFHFKTVITFTS